MYDKAAKHFYWRLRYRMGGKPKAAGYGAFPEVSLAQARAFRDRDRALIAQGIVPIAQRRAEEQERRARLLTYESIARAWHGQTTDNPKNHKTTIQRLERHVFPAIGGRPFSEVTRRELADMLLKVAQETNERTDAGKIYTAQKLASYLSQIDVTERHAGSSPATAP